MPKKVCNLLLRDANPIFEVNKRRQFIFFSELPLIREAFKYVRTVLLLGRRAFSGVMTGSSSSLILKKAKNLLIIKNQ